MTFRYINRKNLVFYLHQVKNENGELEYFFTRQQQKNDIEQIPEGYELVEESSGKVILKKLKA